MPSVIMWFLFKILYKLKSQSGIIKMYYKLIFFSKSIGEVKFNIEYQKEISILQSSCSSRKISCATLGEPFILFNSNPKLGQKQFFSQSVEVLIVEVLICVELCAMISLNDNHDSSVVWDVRPASRRLRVGIPSGSGCL